MLGDHYQMANAGADVAAATGAKVDLPSLIGLDRLDHERAERGVFHG